jgi:pimeloyl-ACP methyl ester carboxylesterase
VPRAPTVEGMTDTRLAGPEALPTSAPRRRHRRLAVAGAAVVVVVGLLLANAAVVDRRSAGASGSTIGGPDGVHVRVDGPAGAPAVVLIHGLSGSTRWWDPVVPALAASYRVVRVDLLGFGRSAKPATNAYSMEDQARRIGVVLDDLRIRHAVVVAHSMGGEVATALAEQRPALVDGLALLDTGPSMRDFASDGVVGALVAAPVVGQLLWRLQTDSLVRRAMSSAFSRPGFVIPQELVDDTRSTTYHALHSTDRESTEYLQRRTVPDRLAGLGKPLLVVFGADDRRWHAAAAAREYTVVPGAEVHLLRGIGHSPMQEDPVRTLALLQPFVSAHTRAAG